MLRHPTGEGPCLTRCPLAHWLVWQNASLTAPPPYLLPHCLTHCQSLPPVLAVLQPYSTALFHRRISPPCSLRVRSVDGASPLHRRLSRSARGGAAAAGLEAAAALGRAAACPCCLANLRACCVAHRLTYCLTSLLPCLLSYCLPYCLPYSLTAPPPQASCKVCSSPSVGSAAHRSRCGRTRSSGTRLSGG